MNVGNRWLLLLALAAAAAAAAGALAASGARGRRGRAVRDIESRRQLKEWENEGGNLAPAPASSLRP